MTIYAGTPIYPGRLGTVIEIEPAENIGVPIYPGRLGTIIEIRPARNIGIPVNPGRLGTVIEVEPRISTGLYRGNATGSPAGLALTVVRRRTR